MRSLSRRGLIAAAALLLIASGAIMIYAAWTLQQEQARLSGTIIGTASAGTLALTLDLSPGETNTASGTTWIDIPTPGTINFTVDDSNASVIADYNITVTINLASGTWMAVLTPDSPSASVAIDTAGNYTVQYDFSVKASDTASPGTTYALIVNIEGSG